MKLCTAEYRRVELKSWCKRVEFETRCEQVESQVACEQVELVDVWEFLDSYIVEGLTSSWFSEPVKVAVVY